MSEPKQTISFSEAGDHGEACISPDDGYEGAYFTLIGAGSDEDQNALCKLITDRFNSHDDLYRELATSRCPRPCNDRPDDTTVEQCRSFGECGCSAGVALAKARGEA